jgi:hypothetical protein
VTGKISHSLKTLLFTVLPLHVKLVIWRAVDNKIYPLKQGIKNKTIKPMNLQIKEYKN